LDNQTENITKPEPLSKALIRDYMLLSKFRLSTTVVGTTLIAYFLGINKIGITIDWMAVFGLTLGGMFVTASANGFNQVYEKDLDKLMTRTQSRPVADGRMSVNDALIFSTVLGVLGLLVLALMTNSRCALLGLLSLFTYTLCYTPMKKNTPLAVFVGAIPGAIPPVIGWVAVSGNIDMIAWILFIIQFFWQFPHFWAIAWMLEDDYRKAGYTLLPNYAGRTKRNAMQTIWYSLILILVSIYPLIIDFTTWHSLFIILPFGGYLLFRATMLYREMSIKSARSLMFATLLYMPAVLLSYLF
jgi:protoheme IX farnesyltransferase